MFDPLAAIGISSCCSCPLPQTWGLYLVKLCTWKGWTFAIWIIRPRACQPGSHVYADAKSRLSTPLSSKDPAGLLRRPRFWQRIWWWAQWRGQKQWQILSFGCPHELGAFTWSRYRPWLISLIQALCGPAIPIHSIIFIRVVDPCTGVLDLKKSCEKVLASGLWGNATSFTCCTSSSPLQLLKSERPAVCRGKRWKPTEDGGHQKRWFQHQGPFCIVKHVKTSKGWHIDGVKIIMAPDFVPGIWIRGVASTTTEQAGWKPTDGLISGGNMWCLGIPWRQVPIVFAGSECEKDEDQVSWPVDFLAVLEPSVFFLREFPT